MLNAIHRNQISSNVMFLSDRSASQTLARGVSMKGQPVQPSDPTPIVLALSARPANSSSYSTWLISQINSGFLPSYFTPHNCLHSYKSLLIEIHFNLFKLMLIHYFIDDSLLTVRSFVN